MRRRSYGLGNSPARKHPGTGWPLNLLARAIYVAGTDLRESHLCNSKQRTGEDLTQSNGTSSLTRTQPDQSNTGKTKS